MSKPTTPTIYVTLRREVDGKPAGIRAWTMRCFEVDADKFEDALAYLCDAALKATPNPPPELTLIGRANQNRGA